VIEDIEIVDAAFRIITLAADGLKQVRWTVGEKLQVALGSAFLTRTYTPFPVDPEKGRISVLAYARWCRSTVLSSGGRAVGINYKPRFDPQPGCHSPSCPSAKSPAPFPRASP
jgi:hypothetical protein